MPDDSWALAWMEMNRSAPFGVGPGGPFLQRDEHVLGAGDDHFQAEPFFDLGGQNPADLQGQVLFPEVGDSGGSVVLAAVAGVDDHFSDAQAELPGQGGLIAGSLGRGRAAFWAA